MWWLALPALAHEPGLSRVEWTGDALILQVARVDAADPARLLAGTAARVGAQPCAVGAADVRPDDNGFVAVASVDCPPGDHVVIEAGWFGQVPPGHRTVVESGGEARGWLDAAHPSLDLAYEPPPATVALGYLKLGVEHILTGWDHLVFLAGLLLVARSLRSIAAVITGFTLAHSITLTLAALGWLSVPSSVVEPAIALSIVFVGVENGFDPPANRRFALTAALGLVHGLGFAGALADVGLPAGQVPLALATFNLGVELGQFGVVLAVLPALLAARRSSYGPAVVRIGSWAVAALGLYWLVQRTILTL